MTRIKGINRNSVVIFILYILACAKVKAQAVHVDGAGGGEIFEGVGAVSAGASSRLLIDYPEPYRSDILDYLFKPYFGAGLQHLKVEIGGDINSTAGTEPSHARTREELERPKAAYYQRGYEYWMMKEARKRNAAMFFDCLEWGAPGWFSGGFYSQDNADYIAQFIKGGRTYHGVDIHYTGDYSMIITSGAVPETLTFRLSNLSVGTLQVWKSDSTQQFIRQRDVTPEDGRFTLRLEANAIYSLTTTRGQRKGEAAHPIPSETAFPGRYSEDFESYKPGSTPRYICDQGGAFEVYKAKGESKTLRQVITGKLILWDTWGPNNPEPFTEFGDLVSDYEVSADAYIENSGTVKLFGRAKYFESNKGVHGYGLTVDEGGHWKLMRFLTPIATGDVAFAANRWHSLKLRFKGSTIEAFIDNKPVASVTDTMYVRGYAGIGTGWNHARFDNLKMTIE